MKFNKYPGEALSYQVLEEWVQTGVGAAVLPKSKVSLKNRSVFFHSPRKSWAASRRRIGILLYICSPICRAKKIDSGRTE